jgi:hypothetical protein
MRKLPTAVESIQSDLAGGCLLRCSSGRDLCSDYGRFFMVRRIRGAETPACYADPQAEDEKRKKML